MLKVILTGASGNLGQEISKANHFEIVPLKRDNWKDLEQIHTGEIDAIVHTAYDLKNSIFDKTSAVLESNILSTAKILEVARDKKIPKFVFISSCSVYGESSNSSEDKPCTPITMNGHTKHFNEELIKSFCLVHGINYLILRAFNSYGGEDHFSVVQKLINCSRDKRPFTLINDGVAERDFIHISDVAQLTCKLTAMNLQNEIINLGSGQSVKIKDLVLAVEKKFGTMKLVKIEKENEAVFSRANIKKLKRLLDFKPIDVFDYISSL